MDVVFSVLLLFSGIGVFLVGMVFFSDTLTRSASGRMRLLFKRLTKNRAAGFGLGMGVTIASQSSNVSTVIVVGLVNAGLLTLFQATSVIFGANVGSSLTMLVVALSTLNIKYFFMVVCFIGAFSKLFTKNGKVVFVANLLIGLGVMFVGLELMSTAFSTQSAGGVALSNAFQKMFGSVNFPLLLVLLGFLFTVITNSGNAMLAIVISMMTISPSLLSFQSAVYLIIGANLASPSTALLASLTANTNAKRAAMIHALFNFIGAIFFTAVVWGTQRWFIPWYEGAVPVMWQVPIFDVAFNVITALILIWLIKPLNILVTKMIKEIPNDQEILRTTYIGESANPDAKVELGLIEKEMRLMAERTKHGLDLAHDDLVNRAFENRDKVTREKVWVDYLNTEIIEHLVQLSKQPLTPREKQLIGEYYRFVVDIKRMAGHSIFMANNTAKMKENGLRFSPAIVDELNGLYKKIEELFEFYFNGSVKEAVELGTVLKKYCDNFSNTYLGKLSNKQFGIELGDFYYATMISFRSIAGYLASMTK